MSYLSLYRGEVAARPHQYSSARLISRQLRDIIVKQAAREYGCTPEMVLGEGRQRRIAHARQYAMWLLRQETNPDGSARYSYPEIANALNRKDHTTAMHAVAQVEARLAESAVAA